jgi:cytochrome c oxidase subunit 4
VKDIVRTWLALLALLAVSVGLSYVGLGRLALALSIAIAGGKATLVAWKFMHLSERSPTVRLFAAAPVMWVVLLVGFVVYDSVTRAGP